MTLPDTRSSLHGLNLRLRAALRAHFSQPSLVAERLTAAEAERSDDVMRELVRADRVHPTASEAEIRSRLRDDRRVFVLRHRPDEEATTLGGGSRSEADVFASDEFVGVLNVALADEGSWSVQHVLTDVEAERDSPAVRCLLYWRCCC